MAPPSRLIWSPGALSDLSSIWDFYADNVGAETAERITRDIAIAAQRLVDHPLSGRARNELRQGIRSISVRPYIIFYRVDHDTPEIVRVLHGRRDIDAVFAAEVPC